MRKIFALLITVALVFSLSFTLVSCDDEEEPTKQEQQNGPITLPFVPAS